jgi:hypothetical protein
LANQIITKPVRFIKDFKIQIHGISYITTFTNIKKMFWIPLIPCCWADPSCIMHMSLMIEETIWSPLKAME